MRMKTWNEHFFSSRLPYTLQYEKVRTPKTTMAQKVLDNESGPRPRLIDISCILLVIIDDLKALKLNPE